MVRRSVDAEARCHVLTQEKSEMSKSSRFLPTIATILTFNDLTQIVKDRKVSGLNITKQSHLVGTQVTRRQKRK
jgi:hypothetical protein